MSRNEDDFGFEETKSTILDYFLMFKEIKWAVVTTIGVSVGIILSVIEKYPID